MRKDDWYIQIENEIYTIVKTRAKVALQEKYPDIEFTSKTKVPDTPKFPTVQINFMESPEVGETLDGEFVNGILSYCEVKVIVNNKMGLNALRHVMAEVLKQFKVLRYSISGRTTVDDDALDWVTSVVRCRRIIGASDTL